MMSSQAPFLRRALTGALLAACLAAPGAARADAAFDGDWSVEVVTTKGGCQGVFRFPLRVTGGSIIYSGAASTTARGGIDPRGRVNAQFRNGNDVLDASGHVTQTAGSGSWHSPSRECAGSWTAARR
jgi:hypothetical protein